MGPSRVVSCLSSSFFELLINPSPYPLDPPCNTLQNDPANPAIPCKADPAIPCKDPAKTPAKTPAIPCNTLQNDPAIPCNTLQSRPWGSLGALLGRS